MQINIWILKRCMKSLQDKFRQKRRRKVALNIYLKFGNKQAAEVASRFLFICFIAATLFPNYSLSQIIPPPAITCVNTEETDGDVTINWTIPTLDTSCGPFTAYLLYGAASNPDSPYILIDSITDISETSAQHNGANGTVLDWFYYMVTVQDCPGSTSLPSDTVQEELLNTPDLDYVTVTSSGVEINWFPSVSSQTAGYIIYYFTDSGFAIPIDTVFGRNTGTYLDQNANPGAGPVSYTIAAFDGCSNPPTAFNDSAHRTIHLSVTIEPCLQQASLIWTPYRYWSGISAHNLEVSIDNGPFSVAEPLSGTTLSHIYSLSGISADSLCFRISAIRQGDNTPSSSNAVCFAYNQTLSTAFIDMRRVSVSSTGGVDIAWYVDSSARITSFDVERSTDGTSFTAIQSIPITNPVFLNNYMDASAPASAQSFYYQVRSFDACSSRPSTKGRTILLRGTNNGNINSLNWNAFELENATVLSYTVYRLQNGLLVGDTVVPAATLAHEDLIVPDASDDGSFCYLVEASYNLDLPYVNENLTSASNELCLYQTPVIYVPNAFVPGGKNNTFKPVLQNPNISEYEFVVFDRWGKKIFETDMLSNGWDGTSNGEALPMGGYAYYIRVVSKGGVAQDKKGMVVLVR